MDDNTIKLDLSQFQDDGTPKQEAPQEETPQAEAPPVEEQATIPGNKVEEKIPATPKNDAGDYVINLNQPADAVQEQQTEEVPVQEQASTSEEVGEEVREQSAEDAEPTIELITEEETPQVEEQTEEPVVVNQEEVQEETKLEEVKPEEDTGQVIADPLPEGVQKFVDFMNDTGLEGSEAMQAYINLNKNFDEMSAGELLTDYYKATKPFLNDAQIQSQLQKKFGGQKGDMEPEAFEEMNIAFQEELYKAKQHFGQTREKYYTDLKLRQQHSLPAEAQEAVQFYNEYKNDQEDLKRKSTVIQKQIDQVFNDEFKGFDFKVGESKYRIKLPDPAKQRETHKNWNSVMGGFFADDGSLKDAVGYNKALYAAQNADKLAQHFYEQGRADAISESARKSKNIDMSAREDNSAVVTPSGQTVKVVGGDSKQQFKAKMRIPGWNN